MDEWIDAWVGGWLHGGWVEDGRWWVAGVGWLAGGWRVAVSKAMSSDSPFLQLQRQHRRPSGQALMLAP